jgi:hypothetical protein
VDAPEKQHEAITITAETCGPPCRGRSRRSHAELSVSYTPSSVVESEVPMTANPAILVERLRRRLRELRRSSIQKRSAKLRHGFGSR